MKGMGVHINKINMSNYISKLLQSLIDNHITDIPTEKKLIEMLEKRGVALQTTNCQDCLTDILFEVKVGKHFRNFIIGNEYIIDEHKAKEFANQLALFKIFNELAPMFKD